MLSKYHLLFIICFSVTVARAQLSADFIIQNQSSTYCHPEDLTFVSTTTGGTMPYTYAWNFGFSPGIQSTFQTAYYIYFNCGTYTVTLTVTDATGQTDVKTQTITINCSPYGQFGMNDTTVCAGQKISFKDFSYTYNLPCTYNWNFDDPLSGLSNLSTAQNPEHQFETAGTYNVMMVIISPVGCTDTVHNTVTILPTPSITAGPDVTICPGSTTTLNASGATQYHWQPSVGLSNTYLATTYATPTVTTTYTVSTGSLGGCMAKDSIVVSVSPTGTADAGSNKMACIGDSVSLIATGLTSCIWTPSTGLNTTNTFNVNASPLNTTVYYASGIDLNGCQVFDSVIVYILPLPTANAGNDVTICEGTKVELSGTGGNSFQWEPVNQVTNANSYHATASPSSTSTYTLTVSNGGSCTSVDTIVVTVLPKPLLVSSGNNYVCPGGYIQLSVSGASSYQWNADPSLSILNIPNPTATPTNSPTTYIVTGTAANGCQDTAHVIVYNKQPVEVKALPGGEVCPGSDIQLFAQGALSYEWFPTTGLDNPHIPTPVSSPPYSITYKVKGTDGCTTDSTFVQVTVNAAGGVDASDDVQTFANNPVTLSAFGTGTFSWEPQGLVDCATCQTVQATVNETTTFVVTNYNEVGCRSEDTVVVFVGCNSDLIFIPNAFSPNGDGKNERFYIRTKGVQQFNYFKIYTRTGQCIFETNTSTIGWDGTFNGMKLPPGVFSYVAEVICSDNQKMILTGNVTLIR